MADQSISQPIARIDPAFDRSQDSRQPVEPGRDSRRRAPRREPPPRPPEAAAAPREDENDVPRAPADGVRGTRIDVRA